MLRTQLNAATVVLTGWLPYFRREGHLTFLPLASALHAMVASFKATCATVLGRSLTHLQQRDLLNS
jgi:hypothetical protein